MRLQRTALAALSAAALTVLALPTPPAMAALMAATPMARHVKAVCSLPAGPHQMQCFALRRTDVRGRLSLAPNVAPSGLGPTDLTGAYNLPTANTTATVAIVDAYDDPNAESDLATYRSQYGLPPCTTANGCFRKVNENGATSPLPSGDTGWAGEISLDVDMVSAICPSCHILLVEANAPTDVDLYTAEDYAASAAKYVSNSWGGGESSTQTSDDAHFNHPGVAITVSSGDSGNGAGYPATSQYVTAVGGTSLSRASNARGWTETAWNGAGSGCSAYDAKAAWQGVTTSCSNRAESDVSAVADPATGVAVYQTYGGSGWAVYGGTSASAPIIASVYALAGTPDASSYPASYPYAHAANLFDVTSGSNGSCGAPMCDAGPGWDGPTGLGTPNGTAAFTPGGGGGGTTVTVANPGDQTGTVNTAVSLQVTASDSDSGQTLSYSATGLPAGLVISAPTGLISGTPTTEGTSTVAVKAIDTTGAANSASFTWTINPSGGGSVVDGGFESGNLSAWSSSGTTSMVSSGTHSGTYAAQVGGTSPTNGDSSITQTFTVPSGRSTLSFWYNVTCPDTVTYDWATAILRDNTTGITKTVLAKTCVASSGWKHITASITAGHSYTLTLLSHDDNYSGDPTYTHYDDVILA